MDRLLPLPPDEDDRVAAWVGRLRGQKEEKADAAAMRAASMIVRTMVGGVIILGVGRERKAERDGRVDAATWNTKTTKSLDVFSEAAVHR
jgi:hypothetical protein